jgi:membrane-associated phospholipid phosphatase
MAERKVCYKLLPVNDPPQLASIPVQVIEEGSNFADLSLKDYCKDVDDPFESLSWDVFGVQKLRVIVSPDGILSAIVPDSNWFGSERIRLTVTDPQSRSAATEICYQVLPVNDPPLFSAIPKQEIREGRAFPPLNLALYTNDVDNPARELTWELQKIHYLEARLKDRHWLYIRPPGPHWYGTDTLWIAVSDPAGAGSITQIPYRVTDVNTVREFKHSPLSGVKRMAQIGGGDLLALSSYPLRWQSEQFSVFMAVILSTATLTLVDDYIQEIAVRDRSLVGSALYQFGDFYGKSLASEITAVSLGLYGLAFKHEKALRMGLEVYESYLISNTLTSMLKRYLGRSRPNNNNGPYIFDPSESRYEDYRALPSGHTTLAFSLSTVLALHMENPFFKALCFTPALVTALQRIYGNYHWTSDVFLGATIGYVIGQYIVRRHDRILNHWIQLGFNPDGSFGLNLRL